MARFDIRQRRGDARLLVEYQSSFLDHLETRFVVSLLPRATVSSLIHRLNPIFVIDNQAMVLFPQFATNLLHSSLGRRVGSLAHEHDRVIAAMDYLFEGY